MPGIKNTLLLLTCMSMIFVMSSCSQTKKTGSENKSLEGKPEQKVEVDMSKVKGAKLEVSDTKNVNNLDGFGAEWDPHLWMNFNTKHGVNEDDWELIKRRVRDMKLQVMRVMVMPEWHEPQNDNNDSGEIDWDAFDFTTKPMLSLMKQLRFAQEENIKVNLTFWGADNRIPSWLAFPGVSAWISAPLDIEEWAENVSVLLQYLIEKEKLDCVKQVTLYNEPDWAYYNSENKVDFDHYANMIRSVRSRLKDDGILDKVKLNISDDAQNPEWFLKVLQEIGDQGDMFNSHSYIFDNLESNKRIYEWYKDLVSYKERFAPGKPYVLGEFGTNKIIDAYHQSDIETYERGLYYARLAVNFLNAGGAGASAWTLFDQYYYDGPMKSAKMNLGLWGFKDEDWRVRPTYHSWALVNRYTRVDSEIYSIKSWDDSIAATALKTKQGEWTFLITNSGDTQKEFTIINPAINNLSLKQYIFSEETLPQDDTLIGASVDNTFEKGVLNGSIGPQSFIVITNLQ